MVIQCRHYLCTYPLAKPPKTVYILKKSVPKDPPQNRYILKPVPGATFLTQKTIYKQQKPTDYVSRPRPLERQWGNDYESLQALDNNFIDSLSVYKKPGMQGKPVSYSLTPIQPLEHHEGVFTPNVELSDGDISIDSGTGNSLESGEEDNKPNKLTKKLSEYKHKPRVTVREQFANTKLSQNPTNSNNSKLPKLQKQTLKEPSQYLNKPPNVSPTMSKSSRESLESRPIVVKPNKLAGPRSTLHMKKPAYPPAPRRQPAKLTNQAHPMAPTQKVTPNKGVQRKLPLGQLPKSIRQPAIAPRKQAPHHVRVLESQSDDDIDEIFKQSTVQRTLPPKPSLRADLPQNRSKRKYGISYSLGKAQ